MFYIIEGNIGAGKSTLLALLQKNFPAIATVHEPLHTWHQQTAGASLLHHFYQDPHRWAFTMETATALNRIKDHLCIQQSSKTYILERSVYAGYYVFAYLGHHNGHINSLEWQLYVNVLHFVITQCRLPTGFIYLQTDPLITHERIMRRSRSGEETIPLSYLEQLHYRYEEIFLGNAVPLLQHVPRLIINGNHDFVTLTHVQKAVLTDVNMFIQEHTL